MLAGTFGFHAVGFLEIAEADRAVPEVSFDAPIVAAAAPARPPAAGPQSSGPPPVLIARPIDSQDGALPSANSVAATALLRLAEVTGVTSYRTQAKRSSRP